MTGQLVLLDGRIPAGGPAVPRAEAPGPTKTSEADAGTIESRTRNDPDIREFETVFGKPVTGIRRWRG